jgi:hypothetical protein
MEDQFVLSTDDPFLMGGRVAADGEAEYANKGAG